MWQEVLSGAVRLLQARADGGDACARICDGEMTAASVVDAVSAHEKRVAAVRERLRRLDALEAESASQLHKSRSKMKAHQAMAPHAVPPSAQVAKSARGEKLGAKAGAAKAL